MNVRSLAFPARCASTRRCRYNAVPCIGGLLLSAHANCYCVPTGFAAALAVNIDCPQSPKTKTANFPPVLSLTFPAASAVSLFRAARPAGSNLGWGAGRAAVGAPLSHGGAIARYVALSEIFLWVNQRIGCAFRALRQLFPERLPSR